MKFFPARNSLHIASSGKRSYQEESNHNPGGNKYLSVNFETAYVPVEMLSYFQLSEGKSIKGI
jgi:hypothetical protein